MFDVERGQQQQQQGIQAMLFQTQEMLTAATFETSEAIKLAKSDTKRGLEGLCQFIMEETQEKAQSLQEPPAHKKLPSTQVPLLDHAADGERGPAVAEALVYVANYIITSHSSIDQMIIGQFYQAEIDGKTYARYKGKSADIKALPPEKIPDAALGWPAITAGHKDLKGWQISSWGAENN